MPHLHLDLVGGLAGDMFIAALLDCCDTEDSELEAVIAAAGFIDLVDIKTQRFNDGVLTGRHVSVTEHGQHTLHSDSHRHSHEPNHSHEHGDEEAHHAHRHYSQIKQIIHKSDLDPAVKETAQAIFRIVAEAEAAIHDKSIDDVAFHEVGAWDSIADILCASYLIHQLNVTSASCSPLPLGSGQVKTAHGMLPVPAPATAMILKGFEFVDDGISGERITPTGAAILRYLVTDPEQSSKPRGRLKAQGFGFGTKTFPGISNTVRALLLEVADTGHSDQWQSENIHQLEFEIDDQTPEQLAVALDLLRGRSEVLDITQYSVYGKKNRMSHAIRILAVEDVSNLIGECYRHTSTLGIRHRQVQRHILRREQREVQQGDQSYSVKVANRPGGETAKVEMDQLRGSGSASELAELRRAIETSALETNQEANPND